MFRPAGAPSLVAGLAVANFQVIQPDFFSLSACLADSLYQRMGAGCRQAIFIWAAAENEYFHLVPFLSNFCKFE
jgi:hypothetical protein